MSSPKGIRFEIEGYAVTIALPAAISQGATMPDNGWLPFSPTEFKVIRLLLERGPLSRDEVAKHLEESPDGRIKGVMATLVARRVVAVTTEGYRLNVGEQNRAVVASWLASAEPALEDIRTTRGGMDT